MTIAALPKLQRVNTTLQYGSGGAILRNSSGALEARNAANDAYTYMRCAEPNNVNDVVNLNYLQTTYGAVQGKANIDTQYAIAVGAAASGAIDKSTWLINGSTMTTPAAGTIAATASITIATPTFAVTDTLSQLTIYPGVDSPNIVLGHAENNITAGTTVRANTISGGGYTGNPNKIDGDETRYATIGGGYDNYIDGVNSTTDLDGSTSTISGGSHHLIQCTHATICGGSTNEIGIGSDYSAILGGRDNTISASCPGSGAWGKSATVSGAYSLALASNTYSLDQANTLGGLFDYYFLTGGKVGIGTFNASHLPEGTLHIFTGTCGTYTPPVAASDLIVESSGSGGITIAVPDASTSVINLGSPSRQTGASVGWRYSTLLMSIGTGFTNAQLRFLSGNSVEAARFDGSGALCINATTDGGTGAKLYVNGSAYASDFYDCATGKGLKVAGTQVVTDQQSALTAQLTTLTHTAPTTADYALQDLTDSGGFGFATKDEGNSVLSVIANLQTRVDELETKLQAHGLIA